MEMKLPEEIQQGLSVPFSAAQIKQRKQEWTDRQGKAHVMFFHYVETAVVIERLNQVFGHAWNFEVVETQQIDKQILLRGRLIACDITKTAYGGAAIGVGDENVINAYKSAVGDAIKLCAKQFGIGLHLWMDDESPPPGKQEQEQESPKVVVKPKAEPADWKPAALAAIIEKVNSSSSSRPRKSACGTRPYCRRGWLC